MHVVYIDCKFLYALHNKPGMIDEMSKATVKQNNQVDTRTIQ